MDPFIETVKGGIGGLSEAISLADDLEGVAQQVQDLGKKELQARKAWRRKQAVRNGDYAFVDAVEEYNRVKEAQKLKEQIKQETIRRWGTSAWYEVESIEARQKEEFERIYTEDGHDRAAMNRVKWLCFAAASIVTYILWQSCMLPMEILIASGCGG